MKNNKKIYFIIVIILIISCIFFINKRFLKVNFSLNENSQKSNSDIINNGNNYVQLDNFTYYREYQKDSFLEYGIDGNYEYINNSVKKMIKINEYGEKEELFEDKGVGEIFILDNRMCLKENDSQLYSVDFSGQNRKNYSKGNFNYADEKNYKIIYSDLNNNIVVINNLGEEEFIIPNSQFVFYDNQDSIIYFNDQFQLNENTVNLGSINIDGSNKKILKSISSNNGDSLSPLEIVHIQIKDDYIYISYGSFEGTARVYNGYIAKIKKDGTTFDILIQIENENFLIIEKNGKDYLIFNNSSMADNRPTYCTMDLENKEISNTEEFLPEYLNVPFLEYKRKNPGLYYHDNGDYEYDLSNADMLCSVYTNNKANKLILIDENSFREVSGKLYNNDKGYRGIKNIEYTNNFVYFIIEEGIRNEESDIGWRWSHKRIKTQVYQKNLKNSQIKVINSY